MIYDFTINRVEDLQGVSEQILSTDLWKIFALSGELGAGKTTLIKLFCQLLGSADIAQSPTFSIVNEYISGQGDPIYHMDFYRIKNIEEVFDLGYEDYFFSGFYCFIEWPEAVAPLLPPDTVWINIKNIGDDRRKIHVKYPKT